MSLFCQDPIEKLKSKARKHYLSYQAMRDRYDCGHAIAVQLNPSIQTEWNGYQSTMDELKRIDPAFPKNPTNPDAEAKE
jgi:hypothetical protein